MPKTVHFLKSIDGTDNVTKKVPRYCPTLETLLSKLEHYGMRGVVKNFFTSYLSNRKQYVHIDNYNSQLKDIDVGVPQGSTLGPLLFLVYIKSLPNSIDCAIRLFADDTCLIVKAPTINETETKLNSELNKVSAWMLANKLTLNPAKSNALIINPKLTSTTPKLEISCPKGSILSTTKAKYLGVIIDDKLKFLENVKLIETKVARSVSILGKLNYYLPQKALLTLYYSFIQPYFLYGLVAWGRPNTFLTYHNRSSKL